MRVGLIYRASGVEYSIERVFDTLYPELKKFGNVKRIYLKYFSGSPLCILKNLFFISKNRSSINHITGHVHYCALALPSKNTIITVHDTFIYGNPIKRFIMFYLMLYFPIKKAAYITCISETTKKYLIEQCPFAEKKIRVIYNPVHPDYVYNPKPNLCDKPRILHIGTRVNKNLERVIVALKDVECQLVIVGRLSDEHQKLLIDNKIDYINKVGLSDSEIVQAYVDCDIVSFPSLSEGFGMPIIEGNAVGRAVLTSNINPMVEVANGSAYLVDPYNVESIRKGFIDLISDCDMRQSLVNKGLDNAKRFNPSEVAKQYINLYQEVKEACYGA